MPLRLSRTQAKQYGIRTAKTSTRAARRVDGYASQLEADYAQVLIQEQLIGRILRWVYEPWQFVLVPGKTPVRYKPDFLVIPRRGKWEIHECKGRWRRDERIKMKLCADKWPELKIIGVTRVRRIWEFETFSH